jgi:hypothetical protein
VQTHGARPRVKWWFPGRYVGLHHKSRILEGWKLAEIDGDYKRGVISAEDLQRLRSELTEERQASRSRCAQMREQARNIEQEVERLDYETELLTGSPGSRRP